MARTQTEAQREKARERSRRYYAEHKEVHTQRVLRWKAKNPEKVREYSRKSYLKDPEKAAEYQRRWQARNKEHVRKMARQKYQLDLRWRLSRRVSANLSNILNGGALTGKYVRLMGCTRDEALRHIESQFTDGMTWENRGRFGWHVDHIRPLSAFDLSDPKQMAAACHYTNLQPLWWRDNMRKGPKLTLDTPPAA